MLFDIQHFSLQDGAGIRTTVFFKGCDLHCFWCHNPESQSAAREIAFHPDQCIRCGACVQVCPGARNGSTALHTAACVRCGRCCEECYNGALQLLGREQTAAEILEDILKDRDLYAISGGGVTFSGGEPFLQPELLEQLLRQCRQNGIPTAVESAVCVPYEVIEPLLPLIDEMICDIKSMDCAAHETATGRPNTQILRNIRAMAEAGRTLLLRTPVVPGFNDTPQAIGEIAAFIAALPGHHRYELLPFRGLCSGKYAALGRRFAAAGLVTPSEETMRELCEAAAANGADCRINTVLI